jgi:hypothetical protein
MRISIRFPLTVLLSLFVTSSAVGQTIARVQSVHSYTYPGNTITFASNNTAGNAIVVMASWFGTTETPTISDTRGNTYTMLPRFTGGASGGQGEPTSISIGYAFNIAAGSNTVTISGLGTDAAMTAVEYSDLQQARGWESYQPQATSAGRRRRRPPRTVSRPAQAPCFSLPLPTRRCRRTPSALARDTL